MQNLVNIVGGGLAGSQAALFLASHGIRVRLYEMRPCLQTPVHSTGNCAELVCSNSFKSTNPDSAAGMLKDELSVLGSEVFACAQQHAVAAGGALAVDREKFSAEVTQLVTGHNDIELVRREACDIETLLSSADALILASGPLTSDSLSASLAKCIGSDFLAFYDAAAPVVMADSLDMSVLFAQSRYDKGGADYLNAPFNKEQYEAFISELVEADRVIMKEFETRDLFQACQPIEEIARKGFDAPRFGPLKPVGLTDPATGRRPWAALQLRAEDAHAQSFNLVGFQTNLTFPEQRRVFRMIPGLEHAEFTRYGVMHRNTFINAPSLLDANLRFRKTLKEPLYICGQLSGTEGYVEAIRSGLHVGISVLAQLRGVTAPMLPNVTAFGALLAYATNPETKGYQPSHVNFGLMPPLDAHIRNKKERYHAYAKRGGASIREYAAELAQKGLL